MTGPDDKLDPVGIQYIEFAQKREIVRSNYGSVRETEHDVQCECR